MQTSARGGGGQAWDGGRAAGGLLLLPAHCFSLVTWDHWAVALRRPDRQPVLLQFWAQESGPEKR